MSLRCGQCGELIRPENINEQEHLAYCPNCGEYTFDNEETRGLEVYSVRELLSGMPPASVTLRLCEDGSRVMAVRPADRSRQLKKAGLAFVVGVLIFVLTVCSCVGCDRCLGSDIDFLLITDQEGKNEQAHLLAKGLRPCAGQWLSCWLNERLLRKS